MSRLTSLSEIAELDTAIRDSGERPVLLFKHSRTCGISCEALDELRTHIGSAAAGVDYRLITVQSHRKLSDEVAQRFGIRHESPQAILLRDGLPVWTGSHWRITAGELDKVIGGLVAG